MTAQTSASAGWVQRRRPAPAESPDALAALDPTITAAMQAHAASTASYRRVKDCGNIPLPVSLAARHPARRTCDGIRAPHATARQTIALTRVARSCLRLLWRHSDHQKSSCGRVRQGLRAGAVEATLHRQPGAPAPSGAGPALGDDHDPGSPGPRTSTAHARRGSEDFSESAPAAVPAKRRAAQPLSSCLKSGPKLARASGADTPPSSRQDRRASLPGWPTALATARSPASADERQRPTATRLPTRGSGASTWLARGCGSFEVTGD
jgi:hypothetical protein